MLKMLTSLLGYSNDRQLKKLWPIVRKINALEPEFRKLSNEALRQKTVTFRARLGSGEKMDSLLPEAFAAVREASYRTIGMRHFDAQLLGGVVLHQGKIAEMKTGEGKTLAATLPLYLNALSSNGAHLVTVNDYLAKRDTQWMGPVYHSLGLTVGCLQHEASYVFDPQHQQENPTMAQLRPVPRKEAYQVDISHGTNNEFGFDYLRDNMATSLSQVVQQELQYAIVDEVDNILIDEARTPLIISGPAQESTKLYSTFAQLVPRLKINQDYTLDEKERSISLTDEGISQMERWLNIDNLYDPSNYVLTHYIENALKAEVLYKQDKDYVVRNGEVIIVDEFTGRLMPGRRYGDGLHQTIEAKERVAIQREAITYATITLQNYFRLYKKLAGMTGTAATEAEEFWKIYKLDVVAVPTNQPMIRNDHRDLIYKSDRGKTKAIAKAIEELYQKGQPVLVGTVSIDKSEKLSGILSQHNIPHQVLNAKFHEREASIVAQAGKPGAVTVATNMAGRGTDIVLGGDPGMSDSPTQWQELHNKVVDLGGLHIIGTDRHEARRIDNQLRGRSGRQGDPGSSRFYLSLEDDVLRRFGGDRLKTFIGWVGIDEDTPMESGMLSKSVEQAQSKVEAFNFDIRKHLVEYDDVVNMHRHVIYSERHKILSGANLKSNIQDMISETISASVASELSGDIENWDIENFLTKLNTIYRLPKDFTRDNILRMSADEIEETALAKADHLYREQESVFGPESTRVLERLVMLRTIDSLWVQHLTAMQNLRQGIGLHAYGQRDPLVMYKKEGHAMFAVLMHNIQHDIVHTIFHVAPAGIQTTPHGDNRQQTGRTLSISGAPTTVMSNITGLSRSKPMGTQPIKVGRNDPCPCGSSKKYKKCHGAPT